MKEIRTILENLHTATEMGMQTALATVVNVYGSSYRKAGARMLIREDGHWYGSVSGGCLEGDVIAKAHDVIRTGKPELFRYDTRLNAKNAFGMGYGCNGLLEVLIEPIEENHENAAFFSLKTLAEAQKAQGLATVFYSENDRISMPGQRLHSGGWSGIAGKAFEKTVHEDLSKFMNSHETGTKKYMVDGKAVKVLFETFEAPLHILVYGAVHHAIPLRRFAQELGHTLHITDAFEPIQPVWNFPGADSISLLSLEEAGKMLQTHGRLAVVFLTHNFMLIKETLPEALRSGASYVGILGSKRKTEKILNEAHVDEDHFSHEELAKIHYPVGLDIGAVTPEEIALSVMAEITAVFSVKKHERKPLEEVN